MLRLQEMLILVGLLFLCFGVASGVEAKHKDPSYQSTPLSNMDKQHIMQDNFVLVKTVQALPPAVQTSLLGSHGREGMADAGQPFAITDVVGPKPLPFRRLILAGTSLGYCIVYDEYGGYGTGQEVSLYRLSPSQAVLAWRANLRDQRRYLTLTQLQSAVAASKLYKDAK